MWKLKTGVTAKAFRESILTIEVKFGPNGDVNVANALVSLQETTEFTAKTVNVMIDSVKMQKAMSVGAMVSAPVADAFARTGGLETGASTQGIAA
ncbi:hypothetical protein WISP_57340 [Willisornis vidua]|uniref:Uncharacterized protein n=1 Tax=Willisornis vidua TaxID=1566151 RepID=A0ABQ9DEJ7_9PASS|nr:hypothetical protein WISP_57340 [Willisornis vidua]